jgi:hypothetical protein
MRIFSRLVLLLALDLNLAYLILPLLRYAILFKSFLGSDIKGRSAARGKILKMLETEAHPTHV